MKWLSEKKIDVLEWPVNSLDLNPIENAWNVIKKEDVILPHLIYFTTAGANQRHLGEGTFSRVFTESVREHA